MAPLKQVKAIVVPQAARPLAIQKPGAINTRSRVTAVAASRSKRKADFSPVKDALSNVKRTAMCDITNAKAITNALIEAKRKTTLKQQPTTKKAIVQAKVLPTIRTVVKPKHNENIAPPQAPTITGIVTRAAIKNIGNQTALKPKEAPKENSKVKTRLSNEFDKTKESLYLSALDEISSGGSRASKSIEKTPPVESLSFVAHELELKLNLGVHEVPAGIHDFDKENWDDTYQVSHYAMDIFNYLRSKEPSFAIRDYMDRQPFLTAWMRSLLVDWMVEVQESFELNHETLYLGVKLVDIFLSRTAVSKETLQLVGTAAMFVASKYDERIPPMIDDFLYICDGTYKRSELVRMEINLLKVCDFNLGIPLSYRFLRRYARCAKITMPVLTLARFVLEYSLMDYATVTVADSKLAAAALYIALKMKKISGWTPVLEFYAGYKLSEIMSTVVLLNNGLNNKPKSQLMTVRNKYSHKIFFEVAQTPLLRNENLLD